MHIVDLKTFRTEARFNKGINKISDKKPKVKEVEFEDVDEEENKESNAGSGNEELEKIN